MRIFEYAVTPEWEHKLAALAQMAEPERWKFLRVPSSSGFPVLDSYVKFTFERAFDQQKIEEEELVACFNTGLLSPGQEEIYGIFSVSERYDRAQPISPTNKKWWFKGFARAGDHVLTSFEELPTLVEYWNDAKELIFDPKLQVQLNVDHIIRDNLGRFPVELGGKVDANGVPTDLSGHPDDDRSEATEAATEAPTIPLTTRNALEGAMEHSVRLAQRSYRMAVPQFYRGRIQLLLPLYLRSDNRPDLALTLERHGGWYRAATVLYPDWAYGHARLLARPNSEWLGGFRTDVVDAVGKSHLSDAKGTP